MQRDYVAVLSMPSQQSILVPASISMDPGPELLTQSTARFVRLRRDAARKSRPEPIPPEWRGRAFEPKSFATAQIESREARPDPAPQEEPLAGDVQSELRYVQFVAANERR